MGSDARHYDSDHYQNLALHTTPPQKFAQCGMHLVCTAVPPASPLLRGSLKSSIAATAERHVGWILHSRESIEPINVPTLQVNQLLQINEDTIKPSLAAQDINPRQLASEHTYLT